MARSKGASSAGAAAAAAAAPTRRRGNTSTRMLLMMATGAVVALAAGIFSRQYDSWSSEPAVARPAAATAGATAAVVLEAGRYNLTCLDEYPVVGACSPPPTCARIIVDDFISPQEVATLREMSQLGMGFGSGSGGPTIFDVASGAASKGAEFVDAYALMAQRQNRALKAAEAAGAAGAGAAASTAPPAPILSAEQVSLYRRTASRVRSLAESSLGVRGLRLTSPSFFSRISAAHARTKHDEYFHEHVDKKQYGSFAYTALVYLSEQGRDFEGGDFVFVDKLGGKRKESRIVPKPGRLAMFTSGAENVHYVSRVTSGVRHALTIAFTCDESKSVEAKLLARADDMLRKQEQAMKTKGAQTHKEEALLVADSVSPPSP